MRILYVYRGVDRSQELQKALTKRHSVTPIEGPLHETYRSAPRGAYDLIITYVDSLIGADVLDAFPGLKYIATQSTGTDHIDLEACKQRNIIVSHVPGYGATSVGELAIMLMLGVARRVKQSISQTECGDMSRAPEIGFELAGKTIGIIGTGAIGAHTALLAHAFGMRVLLYDKKKNPHLIKKIGAPHTATLSEILPQCDIISLHVPAVPDTYHLISYEELAMLPHGSTLINTARGSLAYSPALVEALESGQLAGVGTDVLEYEQMMLNSNSHYDNPKISAIINANRNLIHHKNVLHTLHLGASTQEAFDRIFSTTVDNIRGAIKKKPINIAV